MMVIFGCSDLDGVHQCVEDHTDTCSYSKSMYFEAMADVVHKRISDTCDDNTRMFHIFYVYM